MKIHSGTSFKVQAAHGTPSANLAHVKIHVQQQQTVEYLCDTNLGFLEMV